VISYGQVEFDGLACYLVRSLSQVLHFNDMRMAVCATWLLVTVCWFRYSNGNNQTHTKSIRSDKFFSIFWGGSRLIRSNAQSSCCSIAYITKIQCIRTCFISAVA